MGGHLCQFYQTKKDLIDIIIPYLVSGLYSNQCCKWITAAAISVKEAEKALKNAVPNFDVFLQKGQIEIVSQMGQYAFNENFDAASYLRLLLKQEVNALDRGFTGLRLANTIPWLKANSWRVSWSSLINCEDALHVDTSSHKLIVLCAYSIDNFAGHNVIDLESRHDVTILKKHNRWTFLNNLEKNKVNEIDYRELADSITDSFAALDANLQYIYWNKTYEKTTGIPAEKVIGKHFFTVFKKERGTKKVANMYLKVLKTKKPQIFVDGLVVNGKKRVIENRIYPSKTGLAVFTKDITQQKMLQDKLSEYTQRLEELVKIRTVKLKAAERLATIGETAGMVGHDIRNPLQAIAGELYLAKTETESLPDGGIKRNLNESFTSIGNQLKYINKIVSDLLDYSKPLTPVMEVVDLEKILKEIFSGVTIPDDIKVNVLIKESFPKLWTDSSYLKRILINLITNAVQAMPKGGKLSLTANWNQQNASVYVQDTGKGISEEAKNNIFKPLFTTKAKGQGLGLAVVKKLADALNGTITFQSGVEQGTVFILNIPLQTRTI